MSKIEVYEIDDQFDPLEDMGIGGEEEEDVHEYLPQIPDAELSTVPEATPLCPEEGIAKLINGMPGQKRRLLSAIELCADPKPLEQAAAELDELFPSYVGVYDSARIIKLLEEAGALATNKDEGTQTDADDTAENGTPSPASEGEFLVVTAAPVREYYATEAGYAAIEIHHGKDRVVAVLTEDERYLPLYRTILEMTSAQGGCATPELDAVIDIDPICEEPRRFCTYFTDKLEEVGAIAWQDGWIATDSGKDLLASDLFVTKERS